MAGKKLREIEEFAVAVIGLAMVSWLVMPKNNTAKAIAAVNDSFTRSLRIAVAANQVSYRLPTAFEKIVELADTEQVELYADLSDADLDWVIDMLSGVTDG